MTYSINKTDKTAVLTKSDNISPSMPGTQLSFELLYDNKTILHSFVCLSYCHTKNIPLCLKKHNGSSYYAYVNIIKSARYARKSIIAQGTKGVIEEAQQRQELVINI